MQSSNAPSKILIPFAQSGTKNTIPNTSQVGITAGAASFPTGFPPLTMTPLAAGGVPPYGADFNGVLYAITAIQNWQSAGGGFAYDAAFSTQNGGYPKGAVLMKASMAGYWINTVENNTTNPDGASPTGWADLLNGLNYGIDSGPANTIRATFPIPPAALVDNQQFWVKVAAANTGATTFTPNSGVITAYPVVGLGGVALQGGELVADGRALFIWNAATNKYILVECSGAALQIAAAKKSEHSVNLGQFSANSNTNGYLKIPNSQNPDAPIIVQWFGGSSSSNQLTATFPVAFPNNVFQVLAVDGGGATYSYGTANYTKSNCTIYSSGTNFGVRCIAIGN